MASHDPADPLHRYASQMEPEHLWAIGEYSGVISSLKARESVIPVENLRRWRLWEERFAAEVGDAYPGTLAARNSIAHWMGKTGDAREALLLSKELLADQKRLLGTDHPDTIASRINIAKFTAQSGDALEALRLSKELLPELERVVGADHPDTLTAPGSRAVQRKRLADLAWLVANPYSACTSSARSACGRAR
jgi:hypothetical protein